MDFFFVLNFSHKNVIYFYTKCNFFLNISLSEQFLYYKFNKSSNLFLQIKFTSEDVSSKIVQLHELGFYMMILTPNLKLLNIKFYFHFTRFSEENMQNSSSLYIKAIYLFSFFSKKGLNFGFKYIQFHNIYIYIFIYIELPLSNWLGSQ